MNSSGITIHINLDRLTRPVYTVLRMPTVSNENMTKSRKENPQKPTQLSSRSHPRHLVGKRTAQKTPS